MKKRFIIFGVNYFPAKGGTSTVVENLILQLKDQYDITIYCYQDHRAKHHIKGVKVVEFRQLLPGSKGSLLYFLQSALHILFFGRADFVHAHKTDCALFIPLLRLRFKVIATSHEAPYKRDKWNFIQKWYFHMAERIFIRSASLCTCISAPLSNYYQSRYNKLVYYIPNGINKITTGQLDLKAAKRFLPPQASMYEPYILFSARRLMATKGCHTMLQALHKINYQGQIFIAGELHETPYLNKLRALSKNLKVFFLGYVQPLGALLALSQRAELFIFPSETEGMSIMLLEVASAGVPIVASNIPENTQVFSDKEVIYFKCGDDADLAQKIKNGLSHPELIASKRSAAQQHVTSNYLWQDIAILYTKLYTKVTNNQQLSHLHSKLE